MLKRDGLFVLLVKTESVAFYVLSNLLYVRYLFSLFPMFHHLEMKNNMAYKNYLEFGTNDSTFEKKKITKTNLNYLKLR